MQISQIFKQRFKINHSSSSPISTIDHQPILYYVEHTTRIAKYEYTSVLFVNVMQCSIKCNCQLNWISLDAPFAYFIVQINNAHTNSLHSNRMIDYFRSNSISKHRENVNFPFIASAIISGTHNSHSFNSI